MTLSREADQLLPPIMTPFTGLFQQMQCDPEPTAFPVHSQTLQPPPFITESLLSSSAQPLPAPEKRRSHWMGFLPHNGRGLGCSREHIPFVPAEGRVLVRGCQQAGVLRQNQKFRATAGLTGARAPSPKCSVRKN